MEAERTPRRAAMIAATAMLAALSTALMPPAHAQGWPERPVRIIVPYAAGQGTDVATRLLAERLTAVLQQSVVVENRPGAGGNIGTAAAAKAAPDGYTFAMGTNATHAANQYLYANLGFDPVAEFDPVAMVGLLPMVFSVARGSAIGDMTTLIGAARAAPDVIDVALPSTTARIVLELFRSEAKAPLYGVAYKASSQAMTDVIGGQVRVTIDTVTATRPQVEGRKLKALGITSAKASELLPGVASVAEQGVKGFEITAWNALFAPKGTPAPIVKRMSDEIGRIIAQPEMRRRLLDMGVEPRPMGPAELGRFVEAERGKWGGVIRAAKIRVD